MYINTTSLPKQVYFVGGMFFLKFEQKAYFQGRTVTVAVSSREGRYI